MDSPVPVRPAGTGPEGETGTTVRYQKTGGFLKPEGVLIPPPKDAVQHRMGVEVHRASVLPLNPVHQNFRLLHKDRKRAAGKAICIRPHLLCRRDDDPHSSTPSICAGLSAAFTLSKMGQPGPSRLSRTVINYAGCKPSVVSTYVLAVSSSREKRSMILVIISCGAKPISS